MEDICFHIKRAIESYYENDQSPTDHPTLRASEIGDECARRLWYKLRWSLPPKEWSGRMLRLFETGHNQEDRIVKNLGDVGIQVFGRQQPIHPLACDSLTGSIDGWVPIGNGTVRLIEIKTHNDTQWKLWNKVGVKRSHPKHFSQIQSYLAGIKDISESCLYIAVNKNTDEIGMEIIEKDIAEISEIESKARKITFGESAPPRISEKKDFWVCRLCDFKHICHEQELPRKNCRTCMHSEFIRSPPDGESTRNLACTNDKSDHKSELRLNGGDLKYDGLDLATQQCGCGHHLYHPDMVRGKQIDFDKDLESVTYEMRDGRKFTNSIIGDRFD